MARNLFIAQATLDAWTEQGKVTFDKNVMTIVSDKRSFRLVEAVRFVELEGGSEDTPGLLGRVKTDQQLKQMGAERCSTSVIYQDLAYKVQEGFLAEVLMDASEPTVPVVSPPAAEAAPAQVGANPLAAADAAAALSASARQNDRPSPRTPLEASLAGLTKDGQAKGEEEDSDVALLTKFLLENL